MGVDGECIPSDSTEASEDSEDGGSAGEVGEFPEESADERAERLGQELDESVGGFDEVLANEQREISAVGRNTEGFGNSAGGGSVGGISLGSQASGSSGIVVANTGMPSRASPLDAMSEDQINQRTPDDVPMTVDDDIIARQLREAAISEDDPALRDRLWKEYRKYKGIKE